MLPSAVAEHQLSARHHWINGLRKLISTVVSAVSLTETIENLSASAKHQEYLLIRSEVADVFPELLLPVRQADRHNFTKLAFGSQYKVQTNFSTTSTCHLRPLVRIKVTTNL